MSKETITKIVLAGILVNNNKVLIVQRHKDEPVFPEMWELPSGKKEPGETSFQALVREIKEEIGIDVKIGRPVSVLDYNIEKDNIIKEYTQINFLIYSENSKYKIKLSSEHQDYKFISFDELNNYNVSDNVKEVIKQVSEIL